MAVAAAAAWGSKRSSEWQLRRDLQRLFDTRRDQPLIGIHNSLPNEDINIAGAEERPRAAVYLTALEEHRLYCGSTRGKKSALNADRPQGGRCDFLNGDAGSVSRTRSGHFVAISKRTAKEKWNKPLWLLLF